MEETFRLLGHARGWVLYYLPVITVLGLSALWEILEAWVTQAVHPELGPAYLGAQGDVWDAQKRYGGRHVRIASVHGDTPWSPYPA